MFKIRLRELREAAGYRSQQSFADAFGVAQSTVGNWEAGKREPNLDTIKRLAHFFGTSVDDLLGLTDEPSPNVADFRQQSGPANEAEPDVEAAQLPPGYEQLNPDDKAMVDDLIGRLWRGQSPPES